MANAATYGGSGYTNSYEYKKKLEQMQNQKEYKEIANKTKYTPPTYSAPKQTAQTTYTQPKQQTYVPKQQVRQTQPTPPIQQINPYEKYFEEMRQVQANALAQQTQAREKAYSEGKSQLDQYESEALRQAYIAKEQQLSKLPQQMAMLGGGGVSESALIDMNAGYGKNRNKIQSEKLSNLAKLRSDVDLGIATDTNNYYNKLSELSMAQMQQQKEFDNQLAEQKWREEQWNYQKEQDAYNRAKAASGGSSSTSTNNDEQKLRQKWAELYFKQNGVLPDENFYAQILGANSNSNAEPTEMVNEEQSYIYSDEKGNNYEGTRIVVQGYGAVTPEQLDNLIQNGKVQRTIQNGKYYYVKR